MKSTVELKDITFHEFMNQPIDQTSSYAIDWAHKMPVVKENFLPEYGGFANRYVSWITINRHSAFATSINDDNQLIVSRIPLSRINFNDPSYWTSSSVNHWLYAWANARYTDGKSTLLYNVNERQAMPAWKVLKQCLSGSVGCTIEETGRNIDDAVAGEYVTMSQLCATSGDVSPIWAESGDVDLYHRFDGIVTGIGRNDLMINTNDIIVYVGLVQSDYSSQLKFVKSNRDEIIDYVLEDIARRRTPRTKKAAEILGHLEFWYPSSITLTRASQIEIIFSPKPGIEKILSS